MGCFDSNKINNMKKYIVVIKLSILSVFLFSCSNSNTEETKAQKPSITIDSTISSESKGKDLDNIVNSIIEICADDFNKNQQPAPIDFKNVKLKYIKKSNGEELYILCGQFVTNDKQEIPFATIKNSDYEQWIGKNSLTYCEDSQEIPYTNKDLTSLLKLQFDLLKKHV